MKKQGLLYRGFFYVLYAGLALRFMLKMFEPGTSETEELFRRIEPALPAMDWILGILMWPVTVPASWLQAILPASVQAWFPAVDAAVFFEFLVGLLLLIPGFESSEIGRELLSQSYGSEFPGVIDWTFLLALLFWVLVENVGDVFYGYLVSLKQGIDHHFQQIRIEQSHKAEQARLERMRQVHNREPEPGNLKTGEVREVIDSFREEIHHLQDKVSKDTLTRLYTRSYFINSLDREIKRAMGHDGYVGLMMMDIDNFKSLNDTHGHLFGDEVLTRVGRVILETVPLNEKAIPCRYGGEEIGVVLSGMDPGEAGELAERIRQKISQIKYTDHPKVTTTVSIGVFVIKISPSTRRYRITSESVIRKADELLYKSKQSGKNRVSSEALI